LRKGKARIFVEALALLFFAKHYKSICRFEEEEHYCTRLLDYTGPVSSLFILFSQKSERKNDHRKPNLYTEISYNELTLCIIV
jgi:hypothetical protein